MPATYAVLRAPSGDADRAELRRLALSHPGARLAEHRSRSYCGALALVAWHSGPVGVDLERIDAELDRTFAESICSPAELSRFRTRLGDPHFVTSLWSSKEALAKALGDAVAYDPRRLESPLGWSEGAAGRWRALELEPLPGHVGWLVWSAAAQNSSASARSADSTRRAAGRR